MELRNRFQGMNSASLCSLAGRYDTPIPPRFLAPVNCLKIPAQATYRLAESIPGLLKNSGIGLLKSLKIRLWFPLRITSFLLHEKKMIVEQTGTLRQNDRVSSSIIRLSWITNVVGQKLSVQILQSVLRIRIRPIRMFFGLLDPDTDPLVRCMDMYPDLNPSITKQK